ncbi:hypothetical protein D6Z43_16270 [Pseudomonas sp. DY-1]|uniref:hypothetical protein n=1 Tax=Pseudomonas sp. DY-1 TaxID=1755504 RepID=UPI000EA9F737|nr:hypothetical protein [Pseudomonas sp. DY-1]AYF88629.1 hypothetical protein D6Z43_16270 [Pseudomonas sp. DY-1]
MRAGRLETPADLLALGPDLQAQYLDWLWVGIRAKDAVDAPLAAGLRSPAKVEVRAWWDERLLQGRYLRTEGRLLILDGVRDVIGQQAEVVMTATELMGEPGEYRPDDGSPRPARIFLRHISPFVDENDRLTDYRLQAEVALVETGRVQLGEQLVIGGCVYNVIGYVDGSDDGVVRSLWLEAQ